MATTPKKPAKKTTTTKAQTKPVSKPRVQPVRSAPKPVAKKPTTPAKKPTTTKAGATIAQQQKKSPVAVKGSGLSDFASKQGMSPVAIKDLSGKELVDFIAQNPMQTGFFDEKGHFKGERGATTIVKGAGGETGGYWSRKGKWRGEMGGSQKIYSQGFKPGGSSRQYTIAYNPNTGEVGLRRYGGGPSGWTKAWRTATSPIKAALDNPLKAAAIGAAVYFGGGALASKFGPSSLAARQAAFAKAGYIPAGSGGIAAKIAGGVNAARGFTNKLFNLPKGIRADGTPWKTPPDHLLEELSTRHIPTKATSYTRQGDKLVKDGAYTVPGTGAIYDEATILSKVAAGGGPGAKDAAEKLAALGNTGKVPTPSPVSKPASNIWDTLGNVAKVGTALAGLYGAKKAADAVKDAGKAGDTGGGEAPAPEPLPEPPEPPPHTNITENISGPSNDIYGDDREARSKSGHDTTHLMELLRAQRARREHSRDKARSKRGSRSQNIGTTIRGLLD